MDAITLQRIQLLHPKLRSETQELYGQVCKALTGRAMCRFTHTLRTFQEQRTLFNQGRVTPGKVVTNARPGLSYHNYGLAVDIALIIDGRTVSYDMKGDYDLDKRSDWAEVVTIFKQYGWEWGGDWNSFKDFPHFQKTFGYSVRDLLARYEGGNRTRDGYVFV